MNVWLRVHLNTWWGEFTKDSCPTPGDKTLCGISHNVVPTEGKNSPKKSAHLFLDLGDTRPKYPPVGKKGLSLENYQNPGLIWPFKNLGLNSRLRLNPQPVFEPTHQPSSPVQTIPPIRKRCWL